MIARVPNNTLFSKAKVSRYRPEIDGIRAFAVVAVIVNHFNKDILPGGYLGVDIFFVISGYVITSSLYGRSSKNFKNFISGFYERRIKRILPALIINVLIVSLLICLFNSHPTRDLKTGALSLLGISNIFLAFLSTDYFGTDASLNIFTQTWSLGVEEQFYFIYPLIAWFSGFSKVSKIKNFSIILGLLGAFSLASFLGNTDEYGAYYLTNYRFWEIAAGCLTFLFSTKENACKFLRIIPSFLTVSIITLAMFLPVQTGRSITLLVVIMTTLLLINIPKTSLVHKIFTCQFLKYIGLRSYSLYLWHWSLIVLSRFTIGIYWWTIPIQIILILAFSNLSYNFIESPIRHLKIKRSIVLLSGLISVISLSSIVWFVMGYEFSNLYSGKPATSLTNAQPSSNEYQLISPNRSQNFFFIGDCYAGSAWWYSKEKLLGSGYNLFVNPRNAGLEKQKAGRVFSDRDFHPSFSKIQLNNFKDKINADDFIGFAVNSSTKLMPPTKKALKLVIDKANLNNAKVIIFGQYPSYSVVDYSLCTPQWFRPSISINKSCNGLQERELALQSTIEANNYYKQISKDHDNVFFYDQSTGICPSTEYCLTKKSDEYLYYDGYHVTENGARLIGSGFSDFFDSIQINNVLE